MKIFHLLIKPSWKKLLFGALISVVSAVLYALAIKLLNTLITDESSSKMVFIEMSGYILISTSLAVFAAFYLTGLYEKIVSDMRIRLSRQVLKADFEVVEKNAFKILPVLSNDVNIIGAFAKTIPDILVAVFKIIAIVAYMFAISWELTLLIIGVFVIVLSFSVVVLKRSVFEERQAQFQRNVLFKQLNGLINGIKELTLNAKHQLGYVKNTIADSSGKYARHMTILGSLHITIVKSAELFVILGLGVAMLIMKSVSGYSNDVFLEFLALVLFILPSLIAVTTFFKSKKKVDVAMEQINALSVSFEVYDELETAVIFPYNPNLQKPIIKLEEVTYQYGGAEQTKYKIGPVGLDIYENEILVINGGNGSGKTTLSKVLSGLYMPYSGQISFQDQLVSKENLFGYRDMFSAVFADSHVFDDLRYLELDANDTRLTTYCQLLGVDQKVAIKNSQISTVDLSFGQRGRLNLLRALLEDKPVYLFDEWAANQDPYFKSKFYNEILPLLKSKGKTIIAISHDDHYYHVADRLVTLSDGVVEKITNRSEAR
ncbi:MAG: cyclic peptide export ABC transporter [Cyclobacteriaceae bacterium]